MTQAFGFPFLDRIPIEKRLTAIEKLAAWQEKKHGTRLEVVAALRSGRWPHQPDVTIDAPDAAEEAEIETLKEISRNFDIKEKID